MRHLVDEWFKTTQARSTEANQEPISHHPCYAQANDGPRLKPSTCGPMAAIGVMAVVAAQEHISVLI
jgi:hypothetical protein